MRKSGPKAADQSKIFKILGKPSLIESEADGSRLTYTVPDKGIQIPKIILWLNGEGKLINKHINLFKESNDSMKVTEAEQYLGKLRLVALPFPSNKEIHYISSQRVMEDRDAGISLQVNGARDGEVQSIRGYHSFWGPNSADDKLEHR